MTERDQIDRRLAAALEDVFAAQIRHDSATGPQRPAPARSNRNVWVTATVGLVVVLLAVITIRAAADRQAPPGTAVIGGSSSAAVTTPTSTTTQAAAALLQRLPKQPYGQAIHTWTEEDSAASGPFDVTGRTVVIAGICTGGGAISITDASGTPHTLRCKGVRIQQPFWKFNLGGDEHPTVATEPIRVSVEVLGGTPRYIVRAWAVDPRILRSGWYIADASEAVPESLRTCAEGDLAAAGGFTPLAGEHAGVVTITSRSAIDCAIRSWPSMRYLDVDGDLLDGTATMSLDDREGGLNRFHEFPPARLEAGGEAYLIADLFTEASLEKSDREGAAAAAAGSSADPAFEFRPCRPVPVGALHLTIADSTVTVPVPSSPTPATCENTSYAFGVNPVVTEDPTQE